MVKRSGLSYKTKRQLMFLPYGLLALVFLVIPAAATFVISFTRYDAIQSPSWAGLTNFLKALASPLVLLSLRQTARFVLLAVPLRLLGALAAGLLLNHPAPWARGLRAGVALPTILPETAYALIWLWIFNPLHGPLNQLLRALGLPAPTWLAEAPSALLAIVIVSAFQIGEGFLIVMTGLRSIPRAYYELAQMDGASRWQAFWEITLPLLAPWLVLLICRDILISIQNTFTPTFILTYGGPYYATTLVPLLIYELAFDFFDFGLAAAVLTLLAGLVGLLLLIILRVMPALEGDDGI